MRYQLVAKDEEVKEFMADADVDQDGTIDYEEFVRAMAWRNEVHE